MLLLPGFSTRLLAFTLSLFARLATGSCGPLMTSTRSCWNQKNRQQVSDNSHWHSDDKGDDRQESQHTQIETKIVG